MRDPYHHLGRLQCQPVGITTEARERKIRTKTPDYEATLAITRQLLLSFMAAGRTEPVTKEGIAKEHGLDPGKVQRALGRLRNEGLLHRPIRGAPLAETWRGGGYDDHYSAWSPTRWFVRLPGHELLIEPTPRGGPVVTLIKTTSTARLP